MSRRKQGQYFQIVVSGSMSLAVLGYSVSEVWPCVEYIAFNLEAFFTIFKLARAE